MLTGPSLNQIVAAVKLALAVSPRLWGWRHTQAMLHWLKDHGDSVPAPATFAERKKASATRTDCPGRLGPAPRAVAARFQETPNRCAGPGFPGGPAGPNRPRPRGEGAFLRPAITRWGG